MSIFGKLDSTGTTLTNIQDRPQLTYQDGSTDVPLVAMPTGSGPFRYDAVNQVAVPLTLVTLLNLVIALNALTSTQKNNIWTDLGSGSPAKWSLDAGPNAAAIALGQLLGTLSGLNAADSLSAKIRTVAMYVQDNPFYLVRPSFDNTINIPGLA